MFGVLSRLKGPSFYCAFLICVSRQPSGFKTCACSSLMDGVPCLGPKSPNWLQSPLGGKESYVDKIVISQVHSGTGFNGLKTNNKQANDKTKISPRIKLLF